MKNPYTGKRVVPCVGQTDRYYEANSRFMGIPYSSIL